VLGRKWMHYSALMGFHCGTFWLKGNASLEGENGYRNWGFILSHHHELSPNLICFLNVDQ